MRRNLVPAKFFNKNRMKLGSFPVIQIVNEVFIIVTSDPIFKKSFHLRLFLRSKHGRHLNEV